MSKNTRYPELPVGCAGDEEQFFEIIEKSGMRSVSSVMKSTFRYLFHYCKKGIYVGIRENRVIVFIPFVKNHFVNNFSHLLVLPEMFTSIETLDRYTSMMEGKCSRNEMQSMICWYANNGLLRYTVTKEERMTNVEAIRDMFTTLASKRVIPDCDLFINRRDYPVISNYLPTPYNVLHPYPVLQDVSTHIPYNYDFSRSLVLSMCGNASYVDTVIPTYEDWSRVKMCENTNNEMLKHNRLSVDIVEYLSKITIEDVRENWKKKKSVAVFRGTNTGVCRERLVLEYQDKYPDMIDVGFSSVRFRPKLELTDDGFRMLTVTDEKIKACVRPSISMLEQAKGWKYVIHVAGHVEAFRLSCELGYGSVILLVDNEWCTWSKKYLIAGVHYLPIKADLSDLCDKIQWCQSHEDAALEIAENAFRFYRASLSTTDDILDELVNVIYEKVDSCEESIMDVHMVNAYRCIEKVKKQIHNVEKPLNTNEVMYTRTLEEKEYKKQQECLFSYYVIKSITKLEVKNEMFKRLVQKYSQFYTSIKYSGSKLEISCKKYKYTLTEYIQNPHSSFKQIMLLLGALLDDILVLNSVGIIHMDCTPWNIMVNSVHDFLIIDFGKSYLKHENACIVYGEPVLEVRTYNRDIAVIVASVFYDILKYKRCNKDELHFVLSCTQEIFNTYAYKIVKPVISVNNCKQYLNCLKKFSSLGFTPIDIQHNYEYTLHDKIHEFLHRIGYVRK